MTTRKTTLGPALFPSEMDWARLAAFIDGEGCIQLVSFRTWFYLKIIISNTDYRLHSWCKERFGGNISKTRPKNIRHKPGYTWVVTSAKAEFVIRNCFPYLILKQKQAEVAIEFCNTVTGSICSNKILVVERRVRRAELKNRMHELNRKGAKVA